MSRSFATILLLLACVLYAGCGDDDESSSNTTTPAAGSSAQNGLIVYGAESEGEPTQLFTIKPDGSGAKQITTVTEGEAVNPDWSPDGTRLTYELGTDESAGVYVAAADGSGARNLTPKGFQGQPSFSPDGRTIVFERDPAPGRNGVHLINSDGSALRRLTNNPFAQEAVEGCGCDTDPNFSPDGKTITFVRVKEDEKLQALFAMDVDGANVRQLTPYSYDVAVKHAWSPDGRAIAMTINGNPEPGESANLVTIGPDGKDLRRLTAFTGGRNAFVGSYSPDGKQLVMRIEDRDGETFSLATMSSEGGATRELTTGKVRPRFIDWGSNTG